jgi:hypothetical protein
VYTGSRSVNTVLGVGDCPGGSWWRCVAAPSRLREYVGDGCGWNDERQEFL